MVKDLQTGIVRELLSAEEQRNAMVRVVARDEFIAEYKRVMTMPGNFYKYRTYVDMGATGLSVLCLSEADFEVPNYYNRTYKLEEVDDVIEQQYQTRENELRYSELSRASKIVHAIGYLAGSKRSLYEPMYGRRMTPPDAIRTRHPYTPNGESASLLFDEISFSFAKERFDAVQNR